MTEISDRRKSRVRRWIEDWSTMTGATLVICGAIAAIFDFVGWDFPLVLEKAYAQDQKETHKKIAQLSDDIVSVKQGLQQLSTDFLKKEQRDMQRDIRDLEVQLATASNAEVRRLLSGGLDKANQDLKQVNAELMRRGVQ